ncbi:MAG: lipid A deacylase LpxR family protein [Pelobium sp.]
MKLNNSNFEAEPNSAFFMRFSIFTFFLFLLASNLVFSQSKTYKSELGFKSENDSFLGTGQDRYYTNGLFITFKKAMESETHFDSVYLSKNPDAPIQVKKIWSASIGQYMYNAQAGRISNISFVDRPFATYLYAAGSLQVLKSNENTGRLSLQVGTVGPSAGGKAVQELIHKTFGFYDIKGWEYQVKDEIGFNAVLNLNYFLNRSATKTIDFSLPIDIYLGNTYSGLSAGILFRTGILNPLYHSVATQSNVSTYQEAGVNEKEFYFFLKPTLNFVAYDATISGGLFRKDKGPVTFTTNPLVFSQEIGIAYAKKRWTVDFSVIFKTKEEKAMIHSHQYGSVDLFYRFN